MSGISINLALTTAQATGGSGSDTIAGFENLSGSAYNDILKGNAGNNTIIGYNGNDNIYAIGTTTDYMDGGNGSDTINYTKAETGVSVDLALTTAQSTGGAGINTILNFENLSGSGYNDILKGNALNNTIMGYNGNDVLNGGDGNDILSGGNGTDTLTGGSGSDIFIFESPLNHIDTISDFIALNDTIKLENAIFTVLSSIGTLNATNFIASTSAGALDVDDYILYNTSTGVLLYDMDGSGAGSAIQFATLTGIPTITNADFVVV